MTNGTSTELDNGKQAYILNSKDHTMVEYGCKFLEKIIQSALVWPLEIISLGKMLHVMRSVPEVAQCDYSVSLILTGPYTSNDDYEFRPYWILETSKGLIEIQTGIQYLIYESEADGEDFVCTRWRAYPGMPALTETFMDALPVPEKIRTFPQAVRSLKLDTRGYLISIIDEDNTELNQFYEERQLRSQGEFILAMISDPSQGKKRKEYNTNDIRTCDMCECDLTVRNFLVDGNLKGRTMWANMCPECFSLHGEGIGWGKGQLYQRQLNGDWLMTGGFMPKK